MPPNVHGLCLMNAQKTEETMITISKTLGNWGTHSCLVKAATELPFAKQSTLHQSREYAYDTYRLQNSFNGAPPPPKVHTILLVNGLNLFPGSISVDKEGWRKKKQNVE